MPPLDGTLLHQSTYPPLTTTFLANSSACAFISSALESEEEVENEEEDINEGDNAEHSESCGYIYRWCMSVCEHECVYR